MNPESADDGLPDPLLDELAAYDEALAAGQTPSVADANDPLRGARECLGLLAHHWPRVPSAESSKFTHADTKSTTDAGASAAPTQLGRFRIVRELGRGGCGIVFLAIDPTLGRQVAVKVPRPEGLLTAELRQRFLHEARAAAALDHPNIVPVFEVGEDGMICFIASAYCPGLSLRAWLKQRTEPVAVRLAVEIIATLAEAMHYTHHRGILHRDLKPGNILLTDSGPDSTLLPAAIKITDFGLAKILDDDAGLTRTGAVLGTPQYMAPEQAHGQASLIGPATDVYALGVILYEMLTGRAPFKGTTEFDVLAQVVRDEPIPPQSLRTKIHRDVVTICLKCLQKRPTQRYASAGELALDVRRFLDGEPIQARPIGATERLLRTCRRHPVWTALFGAVTLGLMIIVPGWVGYEASLNEAQQKERTADNLAAMARKAEAEAQKARDAAEETAQTQRYFALLNSVRQRAADKPLGWTWNGLREVSEAAALTTSSRNLVDLRTEAARCLTGIDLRKQAVVVKDFVAGALAYSPDGKWLAAAQERPELQILPCVVLLIDVASGSVQRKLFFTPVQPWNTRGMVPDGAVTLAFSPDIGQLVVGTRSGWIHSWDLGREQAKPKSWLATDKESVDWLGFSPEGNSLYTACSKDRTVRRWDSATGKELAKFEAATIVEGLSVHPYDGFVTCSSDGLMTFLDAADLQPIRRQACRDHGFHALSPDGRMMAVAGAGHVTMLETASAGWVRTLPDTAMLKAHNAGITQMEFSRDGTLFLSASHHDADRTVNMWELASGTLLSTLAVRGTGVIRATFHPDGRVMAVAGDRKIVFHEIGGRQVQTQIAPQVAPIDAFHLSANGEVLACLWSRETGGTFERQVALWDMRAGRARFRCSYAAESPTWIPPTVTIGPTGKSVAASASQESLFGLDFTRSQPQASLAVAKAIPHRFDRSGARLWGVVDGNIVQSWDWPTGKIATRWSNSLSGVLTGLGSITRVEPGERWVLAAGRDGKIRLLRAKDGQVERTFASMESPVRSVAIDEKEAWAVGGSQNGLVRVFRVPTGEVLFTLQDHHDSVDAVAFSPDGNLLATGSRDRRVHLYLRQAGRLHLLMTLYSQSPVSDLAFTADGTKLATLAHKETAIRVWHLEKLRENLVAMRLDVPAWTKGDRPPARPPGDTAEEDQRAYADVRLALARGEHLCRLGETGPALLWLVRALELAVGPDADLDEPIRIAIDYCQHGQLGHEILYHSPRGIPVHMGFSKDGQRLLAGTNQHSVQVLNAFTGEASGAPMLHNAGDVWWTSLSPDGKTILSAGADKTVRRWSLDTFKPIGAPLEHTANVFAYLRGDGKLFAVAGTDKTLRFWDTAAWLPITPPLSLPGVPRTIVYSPDGKTILVGGAQGTTQLWDAEAHVPLLRPFSITGTVQCAVFHPNGLSVVTGTVEGAVQRWDVATGKALGTAIHHKGGVNVAISPDGRTLVTASLDKSARFWDLPSGKPIGHPVNLPHCVACVTFNPDGSRVAIGCYDELIRLLRVPRPMKGDPKRLVCWAQIETGHELTLDGRFVRISAETLLKRTHACKPQ